MLACPNCQAHLQRTNTAHGIFFDCDRCGGRTVGIGVLRKLFAPDVLNRLWQAARENPQESQLRCPHCTKRMKAVLVQYSPENKIELDVCQTCTQVWFDPNEFAAILKEAPKPEEKPQEELSPEAKAILAEHQVAQLEKTAARGESGFGDAQPEEGWQYIAGIFGLPVEKGAPTVQNAPLVTWSLAAFCVTASLLAFGAWTAGIPEWSFIPAEWSRHLGTTLVSSFFLHGGIWHLASNMYFLMIFGDNVEDQLGKLKFVLLILAATIAGNVLHWASHPASTIPCVGASGGIAGVLAYYALAFPGAKVSLLMRYVYTWICIPVPVALLIFLSIQIFGAYIEKNSNHSSSIGWWAHLGGLLVGGSWFFGEWIYRKLDTGTEYRTVEKGK
ncbi:MAG: hypothetical protein A2X49_13145 [Lentisphaerae bacterium GWF2_52_8]|nr:MAG: hypothetical protein A2X49_13145 [Lentisphaerae bacterium GWF2_52_8]